MMNKTLFTLLCFCVLTTEGVRGYEALDQADNQTTIGVDKLQEVFAWKRFTFDGINSVVPDNTISEIPLGIDRWKDKIFLSFGPFAERSNITLGYFSISANARNKSPKIKPYPNTALNTLSTPASAGRIVSVYRTRVDVCNRLWMVDTGSTFKNGASVSLQRPSLLIYNLQTDKLLKNYTLPIVPNPSVIVSITVDVPDKTDCSNAFAYLCDIVSSTVTVYSLKDNDSWRVRHNFFHLNPYEGDINLPDFQFQWSDGVFSVALSPQESGNPFRTAYFHALSSFHEHSVSTQVFQNKTMATRSYHGKDFKHLGNRGTNSQSTAHAISPSTKVMFTAQIGNNAVSCWNTRRPLTPENVELIAQDNDLLAFPSDLKIDSEENIWILTSRLIQSFLSSLNPNETNFRIYKVSVQNAIKGTQCM